MNELQELGICVSNVILARASHITTWDEVSRVILTDSSKPPVVSTVLDTDGAIDKVQFNIMNQHDDLITTHNTTDEGTGLFAKKAFKKGELILVSPVLMIPLHDAIEISKEPLEYNNSAATSILMNYLYVSGDSINTTLTGIYNYNPDYNYNGDNFVLPPLYSDVALFAMGSGASANHRPSSTRVSPGFKTKTANMEIEWFAFDTKQHKSKSRYLNNDNYTRCKFHKDSSSSSRTDVTDSTNLNVCDDYIHYDISIQEPDTVLYTRLYDTSPIDLERSPYAPLDISYRATRDIQYGEELFLDYGVKWEDAFASYITSMNAYYKLQVNRTIDRENGLELEYMLPPQFRCPMTFPKHLFPQSWVGVDCIGTSCK